MQTEPAGSPEHAKFSVLLKPFTGVMVRVVAAAVPPVTDKVECVAPRVKLG